MSGQASGCLVHLGMCYPERMWNTVSYSFLQTLELQACGISARIPMYNLINTYNMH